MLDLVARNYICINVHNIGISNRNDLYNSIQQTILILCLLSEYPHAIRSLPRIIVRQKSHATFNSQKNKKPKYQLLFVDVTTHFDFSFFSKGTTVYQINENQGSVFGKGKGIYNKQQNQQSIFTNRFIRTTIRFIISKMLSSLLKMKNLKHPLGEDGLIDLY